MGADDQQCGAATGLSQEGGGADALDPYVDP